MSHDKSQYNENMLSRISVCNEPKMTSTIKSHSHA